MNQLSFTFDWQIVNSVILRCLKIVFALSVITSINPYSQPLTVAHAQTGSDVFPGNLVTEGTWPTVGAGHELISAGRNRILDWEPISGRYRLRSYDPTIRGGDDPFSDIPGTEGTLSVTRPGRRLVYLGELGILDWEPASGGYNIRRYDSTGTGGTGPLSIQTVEGTLGDIRSGHELISLGNRMLLDWQPASSQYRIWLYDPTISGKIDIFPGKLMAEGTWPMIPSSHKLVYLGNYRLLDWEPTSGQYRIWRFDPMIIGNANPLSEKPVAEGKWNDIQSDHELINLGGNRLLDWEPSSGNYRVWEYALTAVGAFGLQDIAKKLKIQDVTGITVITHGWAPFDSSDYFPDYSGDYLKPLAEEIHKKAGGWLLDYDIPGDDGDGFFDSCTNSCGNPDKGEKELRELVLLFDWAPEANEIYTGGGWGDEAGDALFVMLVGLGLLDPTSVTNLPIHFIGHSFGTAVTSETIERLAYFGVEVDHVTYLDPHDFNEGLLYDGAQNLFALGKPSGYGATVWKNVRFADVYYQTRGIAGSVVSNLPSPFNRLPPEGRPIPGAYNKLLNNILPSTPYGLLELSGDHSYVWSCFYIATINGSLPTGCLPPSVNIDYTQTGYAFSRIVASQLSRPDPVFFGNDQDHKYSNIDPNLTPDQFTRGRWEPDWNPLTIANGNFQHFNFVVDDPCNGANFENTCPQPGWSHHGGGGSGYFYETSGNAYMALDGGLTSNKNQTHNWLYVPSFATHLQFSLQRQATTANDELAVKLGNQILKTYRLDKVDNAFIPQTIEIPEALRGQVTTLTVEVTDVDYFVTPYVWIDDIKFLNLRYMTFIPIVLRK